jgi:hypothetical protein
VSSDVGGGDETTVSARSAGHEAVTLAAYHAAIVRFTPWRRNRGVLLKRLGDVDHQATHPATKTRLVLAGRLIAAAQLAEREPVPDDEVQAIVRAWLALRTAERDDAAPSCEPRVAPEHEHVSGLNRSLLECAQQEGFSRAAWGIAALVLQHLIRPPLEVTRALAVRATLDPLAARALKVLQDSSPFGLANDELNGLLAHTAVRVRAAVRILRSGSVAWEHEPREDWLHIAAGAAGAHAAWASRPAQDSMELALARATERLASSLVPDQPERFPRQAALEHAVQSAFDAAVTALGLTAHPTDPVLVQLKPDVLDSLVEATSSALIGAWVVDRIGG